MITLQTAPMIRRISRAEVVRPTARICYMIRNRFPNVSLGSAIDTFQKELRDFIEADKSICSFESWMLGAK